MISGFTLFMSKQDALQINKKQHCLYRKWIIWVWESNYLKVKFSIEKFSKLNIAIDFWLLKYISILSRNHVIVKILFESFFFVKLKNFREKKTKKSHYRFQFLLQLKKYRQKFFLKKEKNIAVIYCLFVDCVYCVDSIEIFVVRPMAGDFNILLKYWVEREVIRTSKFFVQSDVLELCMFKSGLALIYPELNIVTIQYFITQYIRFHFYRSYTIDKFIRLQNSCFFKRNKKNLNLKLLEFTIVCKYCLYSDWLKKLFRF